MKMLGSLPRRSALALVIVYRVALSPDHGALAALRRGRPFCGAEPTCSTKALLELRRDQPLRSAGAAIGGHMLACHRAASSGWNSTIAQ
jgi:putative component of membrane protein insertase Oxa1/YidC/SpoIIIJ protein YidD